MRVKLQLQALSVIAFVVANVVIGLWLGPKCMGAVILTMRVEEWKGDDDIAELAAEPVPDIARGAAASVPEWFLAA